MRIHKGCFIRLLKDYPRKNISGENIEPFQTGDLLRVGTIEEDGRFYASHPDTRDEILYYPQYKTVPEYPGKTEWHYLTARFWAITQVERLARKSLNELNNTHRIQHEFIMGMGTWTIASVDDRSYYESDATPELNDFIAEWDEYLKLTGNPMRFKETGPVVTDW